jgi:hypothetical protein
MVDRIKEISSEYGPRSFATIPVCAAALNAMERALRDDNQESK